MGGPYIAYIAPFQASAPDEFLLDHCSVDETT